jgi:signal peptidase II
MIFKYLNKNLKTTLFILVIIFSLDRITKEYVIFLDNQTNGVELFLSSFLNIVLIWNDGIAFGLLSFEDKGIYNAITILIATIIIILLLMIPKAEKLKKNSFIIITGGALGNIYDRIIYKSVPDFIDLHYNDFHWFIFNIADIFITFGIVCLIYDEIFLEKKRDENNF